MEKSAKDYAEYREREPNNASRRSLSYFMQKLLPNNIFLIRIRKMTTGLKVVGRSLDVTFLSR